MRIRFERVTYASVMFLMLYSCGRSGQADATNSELHAPSRADKQNSFRIENDSTEMLSSYDFDKDALRVIDLPATLYEISGLASTSDGRLFAHNDEWGVVYEVDLESGDIVKRFTIGSLGLQEDFEGLAIVGTRFFLVTSSGTLYEFPEGEDREHVKFEKIGTDLNERYDVEGLCYDAVEDELLLVCKEYPGKKYDKDDEKAVYSFSPATGALSKKARFVIPAKKIRKKLDLKNFKPSAIERHPETGSYFILSSNEPAIIELSWEGELLSGLQLPDKVLKQPEGIAFDGAGRLVIATEGGKLAIASRR